MAISESDLKYYRQKPSTPMLFVIPNNNFEKIIPFLIQKTLCKQTLES